MVECLCGEELTSKDEFESHIEGCPEISTELWDAIHDKWREIKDESSLELWVD